MIITYRTDPDKLRELVPEPLEIDEPLVKFEFIRMPDSTGFGDYTESGQVIPVSFQGRKGGYTHCMFLNDRAADRGRPRALGLSQEARRARRCASRSTRWSARSTTVRSASPRRPWATSTRRPTSTRSQASLAAPNFLLKIIPHVDGTPRICELVEYYLEDVTLKGAWTGPAALSLIPHALAPVAELPVLEVVSAVHIDCRPHARPGQGRPRLSRAEHAALNGGDMTCVSRTRSPSSPAPPAASARRSP